MKDYTFKKAKVENRNEVPADDFHVEGWNHSDDLERKEILIA